MGKMQITISIDHYSGEHRSSMAEAIMGTLNGEHDRYLNGRAYTLTYTDNGHRGGTLEQVIMRPKDTTAADIAVLQDVLTKYKAWVDENQPYSGSGNMDGKAMSYADFDEARADWYEGIIVAAEGVAGFSWDTDSADAMEPDAVQGRYRRFTS